MLIWYSKKNNDIPMSQSQTRQDYSVTIKKYLESQDFKGLEKYLNTLYSVDIAELVWDFSTEEFMTIIMTVSHSKTAEIFSEIEGETQKQLLKKMNIKDIAYIIEEMESDNATDILAYFDDDKKEKIFSHIRDKEHVEDIEELSQYPEDTAGSLMNKEYVEVRQSWTVEKCLKKIQKEHKEVDDIYAIYITDKSWKFLWMVLLKDLVSVSKSMKIGKHKEKYEIYVNECDSFKMILKMVDKYDLVVLPVINDEAVLVWRITIDDIIDYQRENSLIADIWEQNLNINGNMREMVKARFPWLFIALVWGFFAVTALWGFEDAMESYGELFFFTPLVVAMAWNVWVQASALVVQWLANGSMKWALGRRFFREMLLSLVNGIMLAVILFFAALLIFWFSKIILITVSLALVCVILFAWITGTLIPLTLHKLWINPALAVGPFINMSNDFMGILIYFSLAKLIIWF